MAPKREEPIKIETPTLLVVEGDEDKAFFEAFVRYLRLENIQIMPIGGKTQLRRNLKLLVKSPGFFEVRSLGIIRDADENPDAAFQSVRDALRNAGLPAPERPLSPTSLSPKVTVMILPNEYESGRLETLCLKAVKDNPAMICVDEYFQCLQRRSLTLPKNMDKAKIHVFLASKEEPDKRLGEAAQAGYWPWEAEAFDQVKTFLRQLCS